MSLYGDCPGLQKGHLAGDYSGSVSPDTIIHSDGWRGYDRLVDVGYAKHYRVNHGQDELVRGARHINGIESFWNFAKHRLQKFPA